MRELPCLCGNRKNFKVVFDQNFTVDMIGPGNFTARAKHDYDMKHLHYRIVRCRDCGQLFSTPILDAEMIHRLYRDSPQCYEGETANIAAAYMTPLKKWKGSLNSTGKAIEVGCGSGYCIEALRDFGFNELIGIEPSVSAVMQANERVRPLIRNASFEDVALEEGTAALICAFQVLDHFIDPVSIMRRFYELLSPGGLCYIIIHDESALQVKVFGDKSPIIDISHIYYFNAKTLKNIFEKTGFKVLDTFNIRNAYTLKTWLRMLPVPFKREMEKLITTLKMEDKVISIPAGNIGIIGKKDMEGTGG